MDAETGRMGNLGIWYATLTQRPHPWDFTSQKKSLALIISSSCDSGAPITEDFAATEIERGAPGAARDSKRRDSRSQIR